jgi:pimeloyl-ACP methyl ester carboxylesterase
MNRRVAQGRARFVPGVVALVAMALLVGSAASRSAGAPAQPAPNGRGGPPVPTLDWTDCGDGFQCATAVVPLDYQHPRGQTIELALIRRPAADQANRIGSLFLNPGGPGGSGIAMVRGAPEPAFQAVARFDVVGFDPRGVGASRPAIDCGTEGNPAAFIFERPDTIDPTAFEAEMRSIGDACLANNSTLLPHMSTANVARDLDLLRAAVGDEQLNYLGFSYGTVIGATYATMFPGRSRAMILDSPVDVQGYYNDPVQNWREQASGFENGLDRFFMHCAAAGPACGFGGSDPEAAFDGLIARLNRAPLPSPDPATLPPLNGDLVIVAATSTLYDRFFYPLFAQALTAAEAGDPGPMYDYLALDDGGVGNDAQIAVLGVDQRFDRRVDQYFANGEHSYALFDHFWWDGGYSDLLQAVWPVEDRGAFRGDIENPAAANPILIIAVTYDPATPYIAAERLTADLGNARLLTYQADGHGALTSLDPCLWDSFVAYLNDGILPAEGTTCVDPTTPFPSTAARSASTTESEPWLIDRVLPTT